MLAQRRADKPHVQAGSCDICCTQLAITLNFWHDFLWLLSCPHRKTKLGLGLTLMRKELTCSLPCLKRFFVVKITVLLCINNPVQRAQKNQVKHGSWTRELSGALHMCVANCVNSTIFTLVWFWGCFLIDPQVSSCGTCKTQFWLVEAGTVPVCGCRQMTWRHRFVWHRYSAGRIPVTLTWINWDSLFLPCLRSPWSRLPMSHPSQSLLYMLVAFGARWNSRHSSQEFKNSLLHNLIRAEGLAYYNYKL